MIQDPLHYGWKFYKTCSCGGQYQEWFTKKVLTLKIFPKLNKYTVTSLGKQLREGSLNELKEYIQSN